MSLHDTNMTAKPRVNIREAIPFVAPIIDLAKGLVGPKAAAIAQCRADAKNLPELALTISRSVGGRQIVKHLHSRVFGLPVQQSVCVLTLPDIASDYVKGKSKQALRTNITKAEKIGLSVKMIEADDVAAAVQSILASGQNLAHADLLLSERILPGMEHWVAMNQDNEPVAIARMQIDLDVVWLKYMVAIESAVSSGVRYKLSAEIFMSLASRGLKYVLVDHILKLSPGLVYFQNRLGFIPMCATIIIKSDVVARSGSQKLRMLQ